MQANGKNSRGLLAVIHAVGNPLGRSRRTRAWRRSHIHLERDGGRRSRLSGSFTIPAITVVVIAMLMLSCGDGAIEPQPPAPVPTTVTVNPGSAALSIFGETARFTAEVRDQNGQVMAGAAVAWTSSDDAVATVDGSGLVTAAGNGTATITATAGSASGTASVTVAQAPDSVAVAPAEATITALGDTLRLSAEAFDANGRAVADAEFSWESGNASVASVDGSGLVTAAGNGTATITATAGSASGTASVTVAQAPDSVAVAPAEATITALGDTLRLSAEAFDANGRAVADAEFSWGVRQRLGGKRGRFRAGDGGGQRHGNDHGDGGIGFRHGVGDGGAGPRLGGGGAGGGHHHRAGGHAAAERRSVRRERARGGGRGVLLGSPATPRWQAWTAPGW